MKVCTCFLLFRIFAYTYSKANNAPVDNQRSVNLALETVLEFSNKDHEADMRFLDNVQNFIGKVKSVIGKNKNLRRNLREPNIDTLTSFIQQVVNILNGYEDAAFKDFFGILDDEIRKYHYRGCKFYELTENNDIRKLFAEKLDMIKGKSVPVTKAYINVIADILKDKGYDNNVKEIVDYINSLYRQDAREKFQKVLSDLENYRKTISMRSNNKLVKIVRDAVRSLIFDHYTNLNTNARRELKDKIETFWKQFKETAPTTAKTNDIPYTVAKNVNNGKNSEKVMIEVKRADIKKHPTYTAQKMTENKKDALKTYENNKDRIEIKMSDYKKTGMKRGGLKDEKKGYKLTKADKNDEQFQNKEITHQNSKQEERNQQRTNSEYQEQSRYFSSDEMIILSGESFERNSIEFSQERQREFNTERYVTLYPEEIIFLPPANVGKHEKVIHRSVKATTEKSRIQTIWVEESTGGLPKSLLDKLTTKPKLRQKSKLKTPYESKNLTKHESKSKKKYSKKKERTQDKKKPELKRNKKHEKKYASKYEKKNSTKQSSRHGSKHQSKHDLRYGSKHETKHKSQNNTKHKPDISSKHSEEHVRKQYKDVFRQNDIRSTNMEIYEYKKMLGPIMVDVKQKGPLVSTIATKASEATKTSVLTKSRIHLTTRPTVPPSPAINQRARIDVKPMKPSQQNSPYSSTKSTLRWLTASIGAYSNRLELLNGKLNRDDRKSAERPLWSNERLPIGNIESDKMYGLKSLRKSSTLENDPSVMKRLKKLERELNEVKSKIKNVNEVNPPGMVKTKKGKYETRDTKEKGKRSEIKMRTNVNVSPNDFKLKKDKSIKLAGTVDKTPEHQIEYKFVKEKGSNFKEIVENDNKTIKVTKRDEVTKDDKKTGITYTKYIHGITPKDKRKDMKGVKLMIEDLDFDSDKDTKIMRNYDDVDEWKDAFKINKKIASRITTTKATVSTTDTTTKSTTTVKPTETTTPTTLKLYMPISNPVATFSKAPNVIKNAINISVDENKNKMAENISQVANNVNRTTLNVSKAYTNEVTKEIIYNNVTAAMNVAEVTDINKLQSVATSPIAVKSRRDNYLTDFNKDADILFTDPFQDMDLGVMI